MAQMSGLPGDSPVQRSGRNGERPHEDSPSSEFGDFHSGPLHDSFAVRSHELDLLSSSPSVGPSRGSATLNDSDLLISFDDFEESYPPAESLTLDQSLDYLTDEPASSSILSVDSSNSRHRNPSSMQTPSSLLDSSPTRSRHAFPSRFSGPSSPPRLTDAGADIVFHPRQIRGKDDAASEFRRLRRMSDDWAASGKQPPHPSTASHSPPRSRSIVDAFATSGLATRWKRSLRGPHVGVEPDTHSKTAVPIDISHKSPFASVDQIAGSYAPPDGAPGFKPSTTSAEYSPDDEWIGTTLDGRRELTAPVLDVSQARELRPLLPPRQRIADSWPLLFSLDQHGASLATLYRQVEKHAKDHRTTGNILVVRDNQGHTFGIYLNEPILKREGTYYGTGESFMFKFVAGQSKPRVFRWTGRNQYIALCETSFISFGGGGNSYGLILDATFSRNSSATSPAFDNEVLCDEDIRSDKGEVFECIGLEVWATS